MIDTLPDNIRKPLINFLSNIPVERFSDSWKATQIAIAMLIMPQRFKAGEHVYLRSFNNPYSICEPDNEEMSIDIAPDHIQMMRSHDIEHSFEDNDLNEIWVFMWPDEKYSVADFNAVMKISGNMFQSDDLEIESELDFGSDYAYSYDVTTNVK